jgi:hypothetical protein
MKNKIAIVAVFLLFAFQTFAERFDQFDFEKFKAKKVAYLTEAISLTPAEAEKFWPVYNEFDQKIFQLMQNRHEMEEKLEQKIDDLSDDKYIELSKKLVSFRKTEGDLFIEYNDKFLKILPPRKVVLLYVAEMNFKGFLLREYKRGEPGHEGENK